MFFLNTTQICLKNNVTCHETMPPDTAPPPAPPLQWCSKTVQAAPKESRVDACSPTIERGGRGERVCLIDCDWTCTRAHLRPSWHNLAHGHAPQKRTKAPKHTRARLSCHCNFTSYAQPKSPRSRRPWHSDTQSSFAAFILCTFSSTPMRSKQDYLTLRCRTASLDAHLENMNLKIEINNYLKTDEATFSRTIAAARGTSRAGGPDRTPIQLPKQHGSVMRHASC